MILNQLKQQLCLSCCALVSTGWWHHLPLSVECIQQFSSQQRPTGQQVVLQQSSEPSQLQPALLLRPASQSKQLPRQQQSGLLPPSGRAFRTQAEGEHQQQQRLEGPGGLLEDWRTGGSGRWYSKHDLLAECREFLKKPRLSCWSVFFERKPGAQF